MAVLRRMFYTVPMMRRAIGLLGLVVWLSQPGAAHADCEDGVNTLTALVAAAADPHARAVLTADLTQAETDLWELDEVECAQALQHASRFLQRQAATK